MRAARSAGEASLTEAPRQPLTNAAIAETLLRLAQLLSAKGENPFKVKAYRRAAESIAAAGESMQELVARNADLTELPGIGNCLAYPGVVSPSSFFSRPLASARRRG